MLLRAPSSWSPAAVAACAMVLLAALDLGGAYAAKEAVARRSVGCAAAGVLFFLLLFWVFCSSLQYAELAPVTFGWVVVLQVGVLLLDRFRYGQVLPRGHWVAIVIVLAAQAYLVLVPTGPATAQPPAPPERAAPTAHDVLEGPVLDVRVSPPAARPRHAADRPAAQVRHRV